MRKISLVFAAVALLFSGNLFAAEGATNSNPEEPEVTITYQIKMLLGDNSFNLVNQDQMTATVSFVLNSSKEIVVLSVESENERLESFVKSRLNYKKVEDQDLVEGKTYRVFIRIRA